MSPLIKEMLVKGLMATTAAKSAKKASVGIGYYALAGGIGCMSLVFFSIAGYVELQESFSPQVSASLVGLALLAFSICVGSLNYFKQNKKKVMRKVHHDGGFIDTIEDTMKSVFDGFEEPIKDNPKLALLVAALAGFAAGDKLGEKIH